MRSLSRIVFETFLASAAFAYKPESTNATDELAAKGLRNLELSLQKQLSSGDRDL
jgi:hypothetical protein